MNTLLWAGLAANALINLRIAVLHVQEGTDRVAAGVDKTEDTVHWGPGGQGVPTVIMWTILAPFITTFAVTKFLLFPRGIKSKFAKEQEAKAAAEAAARQRKEDEETLLVRVREAEELISSWAPGEVLLAETQPAQLALGWTSAADAFDSAADLIKRTAGQPWVHPKPPQQRRIRAKVSAVADHLEGRWNNYDDEDAA